MSNLIAITYPDEHRAAEVLATFRSIGEGQERYGAEAVRRVELLRLRFEEDLPIRTIAERWGVAAAVLHHAYALARKEFKAALLEVVAFHHPGSPADLEQEAASLLKALS